MAAIDTNRPECGFDLFASVFTTPCMGKVKSENWVEPLTVVQKMWPAGTDLEAIQRGDLPADEVFLSSDGRAFVMEWHSGPESDDAVYVEVRRRHDRSFHGWVDAESRKIVQAG